jgi:hypothetical protein
MLRDRGDRLVDHALRLRRALGRDRREAERAEHRAFPRPEILGGERASRNFPKVRVHVVGMHGVRRARIVEILEETLPGKIARLLEDPCETCIPHGDLVRLAALAAEAKAHRPTGDRRMFAEHRREAVRGVLACVLLVSHADRGAFEELDDRRQHLFARHAAEREISSHRRADRR